MGGFSICKRKTSCCFFPKLGRCKSRSPGRHCPLPTLSQMLGRPSLQFPETPDPPGRKSGGGGASPQGGGDIGEPHPSILPGRQLMRTPCGMPSVDAAFWVCFVELPTPQCTFEHSISPSNLDPGDGEMGAVENLPCRRGIRPPPPLSMAPLASRRQ